jgi:hypothetical protein
VLQNVETEDEIERLVRKIDVADIDAEVDIRLEQIARLIALDPFTADEWREAGLGREMEKLLAFEQWLLTGADGEGPMTFKRETPWADRISGQWVSIRKKTAGMATNRTMSRILSAE